MSAPTAGNTTAPFDYTAPPAGFFNLWPTEYTGQRAGLILFSLASAFHVAIGLLYSFRRCHSSYKKYKDDDSKHKNTGNYSDIGHWAGATLAEFGLALAFMYGTTPMANYLSPVTNTYQPWGFIVWSGLFFSLYFFDHATWVNRVVIKNNHTHMMNPNPFDHVGRVVIAALACALQLLFPVNTAGVIISTTVWVASFACAGIGLVNASVVARSSMHKAMMQERESPKKKPHRPHEITSMHSESAKTVFASHAGENLYAIRVVHSVVVFATVFGVLVNATCWAYGVSSIFSLATASFYLALTVSSFTFVSRVAYMCMA